MFSPCLCRFPSDALLSSMTGNPSCLDEVKGISFPALTDPIKKKKSVLLYHFLLKHKQIRAWFPEDFFPLSSFLVIP